MVRTVELQTSKIYVSLNRIGLIKPSQFRIRARKIGLRVHGTEHMRTISLREDLARAMLDDRDSSLLEIREALETLEEILGVMQRVLGASHPETRRVQQHLKAYREDLRTT